MLVRRTSFDETLDFTVDAGLAGDSDSIHLTPRLVFFTRLFFFFTYNLCNNRTEEEYPHIKANNVSHHTPFVLTIVPFV